MGGAVSGVGVGPTSVATSGERSAEERVSGAFTSGATGSSIAFQTANYNFQVDGNGNLRAAGSINITGSSTYKMGGTAICDSSRNGTFTCLSTSSGVVQSGAAGASITFQNTNYTFQVNGNGVVSCQQLNVAGSTVVNNSGVFVGAHGIDVGSAGISCGAYAINGGYYGGTFTFQDLAGGTHSVRGGIALY